MKNDKKIELPVFGIVIHVNCHERCGTITSTLKEDDAEDEFNAAMDAIESMILNHAVAGVDVSSPAYVAGIEGAVEACANHLA